MIMKIILGLIVIPIALLNLVAPIIIYRTQKLPARVKFIETDESDFLEERSETFNNLDNQIKKIGFHYISSSFLPDTQNVAYFSLYSNETDKTIGMIITMENNTKSFTYVEFSQLYSDGTMLDVSNASAVPVYPRMPLKVATRFPDVNNLDELYSNLLKIKSSLVNSSNPITYKREYGFSKVEEFMVSESDELVSMGYLKDDINEDGRRGLTLKGAFIITWKSVFPGKIIFNTLDQSYSRKLLKNA